MYSENLCLINDEKEDQSFVIFHILISTLYLRCHTSCYSIFYVTQPCQKKSSTTFSGRRLPCPPYGQILAPPLRGEPRQGGAPPGASRGAASPGCDQASAVRGQGDRPSYPLCWRKGQATVGRPRRPVGRRRRSRGRRRTR